ncbi:uncharacterized protein LOC108455622 [Gossypium arboreum]|uniref:uncharacterized protein LOC108455622 n=1 Tax=Gossypium arboreum TaxID=29729 RepID=UPI0008193373|nr:uncharacterized protein LOC108455622 [Gossypium arboreum]
MGMYRDLRELYWWPGLKPDVTDLVTYCLTYQQVKAEHQLPLGLLQPVKIPMWKWERLGERHILGLELVSETKDKVRLIRERLKATSDRQKSYADLKRKDIEYSVGDMVFLRVSPWKKVLRKYSRVCGSLIELLTARNHSYSPKHAIFV